MSTSYLWLSLYRFIINFLSPDAQTATKFNYRRATFNYRRAAFSFQIKSKIGNILAKSGDLRINLNVDGASIECRLHTHPSHS
jgi:hypothetical protein